MSKVKYIILILISIFILSGFKSCRNEPTFFNCPNTELQIYSNINICEDDLLWTCSTMLIAKNTYQEFYGNLPHVYGQYKVFFLTSPDYEKTSPNSNYAYSTGGEIYIHTFGVWYGCIDTNHQVAYRKALSDFGYSNSYAEITLRHLFIHELYHVFTGDKDEEKAEEFVDKIPY